MKQNLNRTFNNQNNPSRWPATPLDKLLIAAAEKGDTSAVTALVKQGANVFVDGELPLLAAIKNGHLEVIKLLVEQGSAGWENYSKGKILARASRNKEIAEYLSYGFLPPDLRYIQPNRWIDRQLLAAAKNGQTAEVAKLVKDGADIFWGREWAMLTAVTYGHLDVVKLLRAEGSSGRSSPETWQDILFAAKQHPKIDNYLRNGGSKRGLINNPARPQR